MSVEFLRVTHASRVLASASSPGQWPFRFCCRSSLDRLDGNDQCECSVYAIFCWLCPPHGDILKRPAVTLHAKKLRQDL